MLNPEAPLLASNFATPTNSLAPDLVRTISACRVDLIRGALHAAEKDNQAAGSEDRMTGESDSLWRPEVGIAEQALKRGQHGFASIQLALATAGAGAVGRTVADAGVGRRNVFIDGWAVPIESITSICASEQTIRISSSACDVLFKKVGRAYRPADADVLSESWRVYPTFENGPRYLAVASLRNTDSGYPWPHMMGLTSGGDGPDEKSAERGDLQKGIDLIAEHAPSFGPWVNSVLSGAVLTDSGNSGRAMSNGDYSLPGLVSLSVSNGPIQAVDTLIREAARQHLIALMMLAQLTDRVAFHYDPMARAYKSVGRMMADAHAWCCLAIAHATLDNNAPSNKIHRMMRDEYCARFELESIPALDDCSALSETGRAFWTSLRESVHALSGGR